MLVPEDSPLRRLPSALNSRQRLYLDGIRYSLEMIDIAYERLREMLLRLTMLEDEMPPPPGEFATALLDAWSVVDSSLRLHNLLTQLPGFRKSQPETQLIIGKLAATEQLRHGVQHLDGELRDSINANRPAWGWLTWLAVPDPAARPSIFYRCLLLPGSITSEMTSPPIRAAADISPPVGTIRLHAYGHEVSLSDVYDGLGSYVPGFATGLEEAVGESPTGPADLLLRITMQGNQQGRR